MTYLTGWNFATSPIDGKHRHRLINLDIFFKGFERFKFFPSFNSTVYNEKYHPSLWLHFAFFSFNHTETLLFPNGETSSLIGVPFGVFVFHECVRVLVQEISIAALTRGI